MAEVGAGAQPVPDSGGELPEGAHTLPAEAGGVSHILHVSPFFNHVAPLTSLHSLMSLKGESYCSLFELLKKWKHSMGR